MLSAGQEEYSDLKFLVVLCDERNTYSVTTIYEEKKDQEAKLCMMTLPPEFAMCLKSYTNNLWHGRVNY